ncbi:hypothetical protein BDZ97DRAFT_1826498 [Flammula alnicola]|nr:hypothetical protein BDZ97DRAFT_1826498 [Flammula alnicola]
MFASIGRRLPRAFCQINGYLSCHRVFGSSHKRLWSRGTRGERQFSIARDEPEVINRAETAIVRPILTLRPEKLSEVGQEIIDLSGCHTTRFNIFSANQASNGETNLKSGKHIVRNVRYRCRDKHRTCIIDPFPEDTRGFLYYYLPADQPAISGEVRFRICDDVTRFDEGRDLLSSIGKPWCIPLHKIIRHKSCEGFSPLLIDDGFLDEDLVDDVKKLSLLYPTGMHRTLYSITQPFILNIGLSTQDLTLFTRKSVAIVRIANLFTDRRGDFKDHRIPYIGHVKARFELSTLPEHSNLGPTLVLRFLEIIEPIQCVLEGYDGYIAPPSSGSLLSKRKPAAKKKYQPWSYPLNKRPHGEDFLSFIEHSRR